MLVIVNNGIPALVYTLTWYCRYKKGVSIIVRLTASFAPYKWDSMAICTRPLIYQARADNLLSTCMSLVVRTPDQYVNESMQQHEGMNLYYQQHCYIEMTAIMSEWISWLYLARLSEDLSPLTIFRAALWLSSLLQCWLIFWPCGAPIAQYTLLCNINII